MNRAVLSAVLAIGLALVVAPLAISMPGKAADGEQMLSDFQPIMQPESVATTVDYYDNVFTKLRPVALAFDEETVARFQGYQQGLAGLQEEAPKLVPALAQQLGMPEQQVQHFLGAQFPAMAGLLAALPQMGGDFADMVALIEQNVGVFERVPAGLDHYLPLVRTMEGNVENYESVSSLPSFDLMTWFFVVPGLLLVGLAVLGLWSEHRVRTSHAVPGHRVRPTPA
jgi:hypothetical protein